jgi:hypothetical protein
VQIARLMDAVEKGYMREITDDETIRYALEGALASVDADVDTVLKAYGMDGTPSLSSAEGDLEYMMKRVGINDTALDAVSDEIEATLKRHTAHAHTGTILKSQGPTE